jgi:CheY-like chemotaxis protein
MDKNKIAIVDDDEMTRELHTAFIKKVAQQAEFLHAQDGLEGLKVIQEHRPGLIVTDFNMTPEMDGYELIRRVRSIDPSYQPNILLTTSEAGATIQGTQVHFSPGSNEVGDVQFFYHQKGVDWGAFLATVQKILPQ